MLAHRSWGGDSIRHLSSTTFSVGTSSMTTQCSLPQASGSVTYDTSSQCCKLRCHCDHSNSRHCIHTTATEFFARNHQCQQRKLTPSNITPISLCHRGHTSSRQIVLCHLHPWHVGNLVFVRECQQTMLSLAVQQPSTAPTNIWKAPAATAHNSDHDGCLPCVGSGHGIILYATFVVDATRLTTNWIAALPAHHPASEWGGRSDSVSLQPMHGDAGH
jgi:hypothetical protein